MTAPADIQSTADEFYAFPGDPEMDKPPYWVARIGRGVFSQIDARDIKFTEHLAFDLARAGFAEETCEPNGPGAPQVGDRIRILYGAGQDQEFTVTWVALHANPGGWTEFEVYGSRWQPLTLTLGQYRILSRPVS